MIEPVSVFKVVKVPNIIPRKFVSSSVSGLAQVEYKIGEFVEAPKPLQEFGYHLTAFLSENKARAFLEETLKNFRFIPPRNLENMDVVVYHLFSASAIGYVRREELPPVRDQGLADLDFRYPSDGDLWPEGTFMFRKIKLLESLESIAVHL